MVVVMAVMALVAALAGSGVAAFSGRRSSTLPLSKFSLEYAKRQPCWSGAIKLDVEPSAAHVGEVLTLDPVGAPLHGLMGGVLTTLEAPSPQGWSAAYFLSTNTGPLGGLGATPASAGYGMTLQGLLGPVHVPVPDVPAGTYRLVRGYSATAFSGTAFPRHANLCAALKVLPTSTMLSAANEVTVGVSPSGSLRNGQTLRVTLSGFGHSATVELYECAFEALAGAQGCGLPLGNGRAVQVSTDGSASAAVVVHDSASAHSDRGQGRTYPCLYNCVLVATLGAGYASAGTQLTFLGQTGPPAPSSRWAAQRTPPRTASLGTSTSAQLMAGAAATRPAPPRTASSQSCYRQVATGSPVTARGSSAMAAP